jgi:hypothetical protein
MKQIIQHLGQWKFLIANKLIIATVEFAKAGCSEMDPIPSKDRAMHEEETEETLSF